MYFAFNIMCYILIAEGHKKKSKLLPAPFFFELDGLIACQEAAIS